MQYGWAVLGSNRLFSIPPPLVNGIKFIVILFLLLLLWRVSFKSEGQECGKKSWIVAHNEPGAIYWRLIAEHLQLIKDANRI